MQDNPIKIEIYDKRQKMSTTIYVDKVSNNIFRAVENELFNCRLTFGTEFETRINQFGKHRIIYSQKRLPQGKFRYKIGRFPFLLMLASPPMCNKCMYK